MAHGDKRSVSTDALETLGTIIGSSAGRDAIHLAVEPVIAAEDLAPSERVGFVDGGVGRCNNPVGIVDPFLSAGPRRGERFWLVVFPRQITSLRHVWTHPAFSDAAQVINPDKWASEQWLKDFCSNNDCPAWQTVKEVLMSEHGVELVEDYGATRIEGDDYLTFRGVEAHCDVPPEFWDHAEIVTGKKFPNRPASFSCTC